MFKRKRVFLYSNIFLTLIVGTSVFFIPGIQNEARADDAGAFVGGMVAGHVLNRVMTQQERQTRAMEYQAYSQPRQHSTYSSQTRTAPAQPTVEQRLDKLDTLAQKGYITPEEYKMRRKAILDDL